MELLYYPCSETKGADHLCSYCTTDSRLCFSHIMLVFILSVNGTNNEHFMNKSHFRYKPEDQWSCKCSPEIWDIYQ